jgi:transposase
MDLSEKQWRIVRVLLPPDSVRPDHRGRPWTDQRQVLNGVLWILRTGAPWGNLPARYGNYKTVHRRFQQWERMGTLENVLLALVQDLKDRGGLDLWECYIPGTVVGGKPGSGGTALAAPATRRDRESWLLPTVMVFRSPHAQQVLARWK